MKAGSRSNWVFRLLFLLNTVAAAGGYIVYFQSKYELSSAGVSQTTTVQILQDTNEIYLSSSAAVCFLLFVAMLLFSFNKKMAAIVILALSLIAYLIVINIF